MELLLEEHVKPLQLLSKNQLEGRHWRTKSNAKKKYLSLLKFKNLFRKPFRFPVRLEVVRVLGPGERKWDYSNIGGGSFKQLEDCLVELGWFTDDSPKYITQVDFEQDDTQRKNGPSVIIRVYST